jgi:sporulation protein YlmC with PRC-barrel domain
MKNSQLKGLSVISIAEGKKLGTIARVFFDPATQQVVAFEVHQGGGLLGPEPDRSRMIDVEEVQALGPDALMIADESALRSQETAGPSADLVELDALTSRKVVAEGGTQVGAVASTDVDERTFHLRSVEVSPGFFQTNREIPADQVVSIGIDVLVVTDAVCAPEPASDAGSPAADAGRHFVVVDERNQD